MQLFGLHFIHLFGLIRIAINSLDMSSDLLVVRPTQPQNLNEIVALLLQLEELHATWMAAKAK
jgi:hypothetical protein